MKVLYFHQHFSTPKGSTGIRSYEMAKRLIARGHEVTMVCGSYSGGGSGLATEFKHGRRCGVVDGINIIEFDLAYSNSIGFLARTGLFLKFALRSIGVALTEPYDLVFATTTPLTASIPGIFARWLRKKPFVFEVRDLWPELPKSMGVIKNPIVLGAMSLLELISYRSAHRLIGLSPGIVNGIAGRGISRRKITLVPNGCDLEIFSDVTEAWRPADISPDILLAVFAGTHGIANGLENALEAAAELKRRKRNDIKLLFIGQGKLKTVLQHRAVQEGLDNVYFHDPINKKKLAKLMAGSDLGLQLLANVPAFYYGTSPNKFFDYIAAGLPVLNNYPGWVSELIEQNHCGFVVRPDDPVAFADALEAAAKDRQKLKEMGQQAKLLATRQFNRETLANQFVDWVEMAYNDKKMCSK